MFQSIKRSLHDILKDVHGGRMQLPDFQRSYVWDDEDLRSLIVSVASGYPVGALLTLGTGGSVRFKPRLLEGVKAANPGAVTVAADDLLLDGQQRITSLYQAAFSTAPVRTRTKQNREVDRYYYFDIRKAVQHPDDLYEAIVALPADRVERTNFGRDVVRDVSTPEREYEHCLFPINRSFDWTRWNFAWVAHWQNRNAETWSLSEAFFNGPVGRLKGYDMPIIALDKDNSRAAICTVFEKVNVGGKKLDAFELVTAIYAADNFDLREDWDGQHHPTRTAGRRQRMISEQNPRDVLANLTSVDFLKACSLLHTRARRVAEAAKGMSGSALPQIACTRDAILALPLGGYQAHAAQVEAGFIEAARFLNSRKIIWRWDVPYPDQTTVLAALYATLGSKAKTAAAEARISRWFWSVAFGELYGSATDSRLARDLPELAAWIADDGPLPRACEEALFRKDRLRSLRSRNAAAYKALHALLMKQGCRDFITGHQADLMTFFSDKIDIHHVFPKSWASKRGIPPHVFNAVVNKTPLSAASNKSIGGDAPSVYLRRIERDKGLSAEMLDDILRSHLIEPDTLRRDDFDAFFAARSDALSGLVAGAMEKDVVRSEGSNEPERDLEDADAEDDEMIIA